MLKRIRITVEAQAIMPEHLVKRLEGLTGPRDRKELAQMVIEEDHNPLIIIIESKKV